ncbi:alpha-1,6-mannosyl-glycoprotein 4-beta-N-acetylglucosaminyltransferase-like [Clytia hemisphaerica]|uniref:Uncharacterized protein n=1 Tax=Clytia hemisphaerica TaxID=252671 RepID=A0A7M5UNB8_9CNID
MARLNWRGIFRLLEVIVFLSFIGWNIYHVQRKQTNSVQENTNKEDVIKDAPLTFEQKVLKYKEEMLAKRKAEESIGKKTRSIKNELLERKDILKSFTDPGWTDVRKVESYFDVSKILKVGQRNKDSAIRFAFGIPTVSRKNAYYVIDTIKSILQNMTPSKRDQIILLIMIADENQSFIEKVISDIERNFPQDIEDGLIQVIVPDRNYYPDLTGLPRLYNDQASRVQWRSKQALDYSYMFYYAIDIADYYVQLEDDILVAPEFYQHMEIALELHKYKEWSVLEFGSRGFIGMMYRNKDLPLLARFTRFFYWVMPVDWLFRAFNDIVLYGNSKLYKTNVPLFKHVGAVSSLRGQKRHLEDLEEKEKRERNIKRAFKTSLKNPEAVIFTTVADYVHPHSIENAYQKSGMFWGKSLADGDRIEIRFKDPQHLKRFVISSGSFEHPDDRLGITELSVSQSFPYDNERCHNYKLVKTFDSDVIDHKFQSTDEPIECVQLALKRIHKTSDGKSHWLIIEHIEIVVE